MGLRQARHSQPKLSLRRVLVFPVGSGRDGDAETQCAICSGNSGGPTMIPLTEDIEILTAGYLSALKSNSDEIVRLADALRAAEAERNTATAELVETRLALMNAEACRAEAEKQANTARDERDAL